MGIDGHPSVPVRVEFFFNSGLRCGSLRMLLHVAPRFPPGYYPGGRSGSVLLLLSPSLLVLVSRSLGSVAWGMVSDKCFSPPPAERVSKCESLAFVKKISSARAAWGAKESIVG